MALAISTGMENCHEQQQDHVAGASAEHLADADLPGAAPGGEGGQAEQPQAGDEDGDADENREDLALPLVA